MTDIAVVGAGPAGIAAAVAAAHAGAEVTLIDEYAQPGGQYYKQPAWATTKDRPYVLTSLAENIEHGRELLDQLDHPKIHLLCNTLVWNIIPERALDLYGPEGTRRLSARKVIIASGAYERVAPFSGWTLPGVTTVGAAQLLLKGQGMLIGQRILIAGTGPLLQLAAVQLLDAGAEISAIVEVQSRSEFVSNASKLFGQWGKIGQGMANQKRLMDARVPIKYGYAVIGASGSDCVEEAIIAKVDIAGRPIPRSEERLAVDTICLNYGFVPATELTRLAGCEMYFDPHFGSFATKTNDELETSRRGIFAAGEVRGIGGVEVALLEGRIAGLAAARQLGCTPDGDGNRLRKEWQKMRAAMQSVSAMFAFKAGVCDIATDEVLVCRCEEITAGDIRQAARNGALQLNSLKAWNRCGMGRCQGRMCGPIAAQLIANQAKVSLESVGTFTARTPIKPVPLSVVGAVQPAYATGPAMEDHVGYGRAVIRR